MLGTHCLVEACRAQKVRRLIHISTDEVYGEVVGPAAKEADVLNPTNPYSASKAAAEMIVSGYQRSFRLPVMVVRANNLFGPRQFPEKIIPRFVCHLLLGRKLPIHGSGENRRHYLSVRDFADAIAFLAERGECGQTYNIGTNDEYTNLEVAALIAANFGLDMKDVIDHVPDRPFNDSRYSISWNRLEEMGWRPRRKLVTELPAIIDWYQDNLSRYSIFAEEEEVPKSRIHPFLPEKAA